MGENDILSVTNMSSTAEELSFSYSVLASAAQGQTQGTGLNKTHPGSGMALLKDMPIASIFAANPPPYTRPLPRSLTEAAPVYSKGDEAPFYVLNKNQNGFNKITASLEASETYCDIWVDMEVINNSNLTAQDFLDLAKKFDEIYPLATKLLGFENGGDPEEPDNYGGIDGRPQIQILVYDINYGADIKNEGGILGFFFGIDQYPQSFWDSLPGLIAANSFGFSRMRSNEAEIFYIDSGFLELRPNTVHSTLIHEFQHMVNFYQKVMKKARVTETWYTEMLSMLAEDVIGPLVGIDPAGHPINTRIPLFLDIYDWFGVDKWHAVRDEMFAYTYSTVYAFGAYLIRNYGGPELIKEMMFNNSANQTSVTQAMRALNGADSSYSFNYALEHYGEALACSADDGEKRSFNKTAVYTVDIEGREVRYEAAGFNIWDMSGNFSYRSEKEEEWGIPVNLKGPVIYPIFPEYKAPSHSIRLQSGAINGYSEDFLVRCTYSDGADIRLKVYK